MASVKKDYTTEEYEAQYNHIHALYDLAEELLYTVESKFVSDPEAQLAIIEPLINEIGDATDVLTQEFILIAESKKNKGSNKASKLQVETSLRKIFAAINDYHDRVRNISKKAHGALMNIADPIVQKILKQIELVVIIFFEFMHISLQSIMNKAELESLKLRDARVALMMHQYALSQQQT